MVEVRRSLPCLKPISVALAVSLAVSAPAQDAAPIAPAAVAAFRAGQQAFQREEFDAAISQFKAAIAADARFAAAHCALGQTYMTLRRYAEAVDALVQCKATTERQVAADASARAAQQRDIDREMVELREAISRIRSGQVKTGSEQTVVRIEERLRKLEESRNRGPAAAAGVPPAISYALGTAYLRVGSLELAERELREAVRQKPDMGEAHNNLAAVYVGLGRWDEAAVHVRAAESAGFAVSAALKADVAARRSSGPAPPPAGAAPPASAAAPAPPPVALSIAHEPVSCVASGTFPRIEAGVVPGAASTAKVFFQTEASAGWYAVRMRADDERYAAVLPRPRSTGSFRYYIEATGEDTTTARTPERVVTVVDRAARCAGGISASVGTASGIVVEPPAGAAKGRLVPAGFSARGTVGDIGQFEMGTKVAIGAGVVLAGAAVAGAAVAASKSSGSGSPPTTIPARPDLGGDIVLLTSDPAPGGTISLAGSVVAMSFRAVSPYDVPAGPARVQFSNTGGFFTACGTLTGSHPDLHPNEPITVAVSGRVTNSGFCGDRFDVRLIRVLLQAPSGPLVLQTGTGFLPDIPLTFTVVP
jgi:Flp pilus assembly protein TadD